MGQSRKVYYEQYILWVGSVCVLGLWIFVNELTTIPLSSDKRVDHIQPLQTASILGCKCKSMVDGSEWECKRDAVYYSTVKHCKNVNGHGFFEIVPNSTIQHVAAIVRMNGPIIDTMLFKLSPAPRSNASIWISNYSSCVPGNYTAAVHIYLQDDDPLSVMLGKSCLDPHFESPFMFAWTEPTARMPCPHLWFWINGSSNDALTRYNPGKALHHRSTFAGLRSTIPDFPFSADGVDGRPDGLVCLFGDSHMRNLVNGVGMRMNPRACNMEAMQSQRRPCQVGGGAQTSAHNIASSAMIWDVVVAFMPSAWVGCSQS